LLALHLENGKTDFGTLRNKYGLTDPVLNLHLKPMHFAGLLRYDGHKVEQLGASK